MFKAIEMQIAVIATWVWTWSEVLCRHPDLIKAAETLRPKKACNPVFQFSRTGHSDRIRGAERDRLQCFNQSTTLITNRTKQRVDGSRYKLARKGPRGISKKQVSVLLPKCVESQAFKSHVHFMCNSRNTTVCAHPTSYSPKVCPKM